MLVSEALIKDLLRSYKDPYLEQDLVSQKAIKNIQIQPDKVVIDIVLGYPNEGFKNTLIADLEKVLAPAIQAAQLTIQVSTRIEPHVGQKSLKGLPTIKNIIPVASGKGGVGKSTVSVNIALALLKEGARVGILDADIYGPSQPMMLGAKNPPEIEEGKANKVLLPVKRYGLQTMSIGYLINENTPMIWRGPMVSTALQQLLNDTEWEDLDYLIIDLPPGTGDIQLTLAQKIPVSAAVIVSTPQDLALLDASRAYEMFRKVSIPVLGIIENMSTHVCSACGHEEAIFGEGGAERFAKRTSLPFLGSLPLDMKIREQTDAGTPPVALDPESEIAKRYREIARKVSAKLSLQQKDYSSKFPGIVVKHD